MSWGNLDDYKAFHGISEEDLLLELELEGKKDFDRGVWDLPDGWGFPEYGHGYDRDQAYRRGWEKRKEEVIKK